MPTKPQDVVVALKLSIHGMTSSYAALAESLGMSASETHAAVRRLTQARLFDPVGQQIDPTALRLFLVHGVPYAFPVHPQHSSRGMPTAWAAPLQLNIPAPGALQTPVWPDAAGTTQGTVVEPLYPSVPLAARNDAQLYELLALVDVLRLGLFHEKARIVQELGIRLADPVPVTDLPAPSEGMPSHLL